MFRFPFLKAIYMFFLKKKTSRYNAIDSSNGRLVQIGQANRLIGSCKILKYSLLM